MAGNTVLVDPPEVAAPPLPRFSDEDRLLLALTTERERRLAAEAANIKMASDNLKAQDAAFKVEQKATMDTFKERYQLGTEDTVDLKTGLITRAP